MTDQTSKQRLCICADPEYCTVRAPGYRCKKDLMPQSRGPCKGIQSHDWKMFCQCCGCPYPGVVVGDHHAPTMTPFETSPFPYPTDRDGWICSVCDGWNVPKDRVCMHSHLPKHLRPAVEPSRRIPPREFDIESHTGLYTEPSPRMAIEGDLVPEQWWRVHRELANGHTSAALAVVAAVLEGRPLPECAACDVTKLTINAEKAAPEPEVERPLTLGESASFGRALARSPRRIQEMAAEIGANMRIAPDADCNGSACTLLRQMRSEKASGLCPDALLPDGEHCPRCGCKRAPSGIDGGSWVHVVRSCENGAGS